MDWCLRRFFDFVIGEGREGDVKPGFLWIVSRAGI